MASFMEIKPLRKFLNLQYFIIKRWQLQNADFLHELAEEP